MDTNPATEVTSDEAAEAKLEALFTKNEGKTAEPAEESPPPQDDDAEEVEDDQPEATTEEEEQEDLDIDGFTLKLPKSKAEKLKAERLMQADYTRKTQELAERNRLAEMAEKRLQLSAQAQSVLGQKQAELIALQQQMSQFQSVNWQELTADQAYPLIARRDELKQAAERAQAELQHMGQQFMQAQSATEQEYKQKLTELGLARLNDELKGWTQDKQADAAEHLDRLGYKPHELESFLVYDPRFMRMAYEAAQFQKLQASKAQTIQKKVATAKPMQAQASRGVQKSTQDSRLQDLRERVKKQGRAEDVESLLAARFSKKYR